MGAGKTYTAGEIMAMAKVKLANPGVLLGPVWWEQMAAEERLPQVLIDRIKEGGDISKFINRHPNVISEAITEIVMSRTVTGRSHLQHTLI
jgi:hypothetical protein